MRVIGDADQLSPAVGFSNNFQLHTQTTQFLCHFESATADDVLKCVRLIKMAFCLLDPIKAMKFIPDSEASAAIISKIISSCFEHM